MVRLIKGENDLATVNPKLSQEWHPTKNGNLKPEDVSSGSGKEVWWLCPAGHSYLMVVNQRAKRGYNCPYCSGHRALLGVNDLSTTNPELAKEWNYRTPKAKDDYQYSPNEVVANFDYVGWIGEYEAKKQKKVKNIPYGNNDINNYLDCLYIGILSREDVEKRLSGSQYAKYHKKIDDVCAKRMQDVAKQRNAERKSKGEKVKVVWIFGPAGTGKTRFAKEQAAKQDEHYYITGSSRDPFQRYNGEDVIIYDEARPGDIAFSDLLKLLDPYGEDVAAPSRYFDKSICAGTFYITSPYSPLDYYKKIMGGGWAFQTDKYEQLLRRLTLVIQITEESIQAVRYNIQGKKFLPIPETVRPNTYWQEAKKNKDESITLFNSFFDDATPNISESDEPCEQMRIPE